MTNLFIQKLEGIANNPEQINPGQHIVSLQYFKTQRNYKESNAIVFDTIVWAESHNELHETLDVAEINEVIIVDHSTALMSLLTSFLKKGWNVQATSVVYNNGFSGDEDVEGLKLSR